MGLTGWAWLPVVGVAPGFVASGPSNAVIDD